MSTNTSASYTSGEGANNNYHQHLQQRHELSLYTIDEYDTTNTRTANDTPVVIMAGGNNQDASATTINQNQNQQHQPRLSLFQRQVNNLLRSFVHSCGDIFPPTVFKANFLSSQSNVVMMNKNNNNNNNVDAAAGTTSILSTAPSQETIESNKFELAKNLIVNFIFTNELFISSPMFHYSKRNINDESSSNKKEDNNNINNNNEDDDEELEELEDPFSSESEFILCKHAQYLVAWWRRAVAMHSIVFREAFPTRHAFLQAVQHAISDFHSILTAWINRRLQATSTLPRVMRLGMALKLSAAETEALIFILVHHCATKLPISLDKDFTNSMHNIGYYCGMSSRELMYFAGPSRLHCKQGVVHVPERLTPVEEARVRMPVVVATALSGARLSQEETVKLEKTALCDMLIDDGDIPSGLAVERGEVMAGDDANTRKGNRKNNNTSDETSLGDMTIVNNSFSPSSSTKVSPKLSGKRRVRDEEGSDDEDEEGSDDDDGSYSSSSGSDDDDDGSASSSSDAPPRTGRNIKGGKKPTAKRNSNNNNNNKRSLELPKKKQTQQLVLSSQPASPTEGFQQRPHLVNNKQFPNAASDSHHQQPLPSGIEPYTDNKSYMEDGFNALAALIKARNAEGDVKDEDGYFFNPKNSVEAQLRELKGKERVTRAKLQARLEATRRLYKASSASASSSTSSSSTAPFLPKIEELGDKLNLSTFEKFVLLLLVGNVISHDILIAINGRYVMRDGAMQITVGYILFILCENLAQRINGRRCFTKESPLLKSGLISVNPPDGRSSFTSDLVEFAVDIDRKIVDQMVGLETSPGEMVQGSKMYTPKVTLADVVLPEDTKTTVMSAIQHYQLFAECTANCGLREGLSANASAHVLLLSGPSGSGKTLLAHALTAELKKKILLVNAMSVKNSSNPGDTIRFLFREAKLSGGVLFFDECEELLATRTTNPAVTSILNEFELFDGVVILATTHAHVIDSAFNRRISTVIEFKNPDHRMRKEIWLKHLPAKIPLHRNVNLDRISLEYELSGGLVKNAALAAIRFAVEREKSAMPSFLTHNDLERGARSQLRGLFHVSAADSALGSGSGHQGNRIITPSKTFSDIVVDENTAVQMDNLIRKIKSRNILFGQWGWEGGDGSTASSSSSSGGRGGGGSSNNSVIEPLTILVKGAEGSGKSLFAEILAHECGINMRIDNLSALLLKGKDLVGEMENLFAEARNVGAAVVLDGAEELFGSDQQAEQVSMLLQYHASKFRRPILLLAKTGSGGSGGDGAGGSGRRSYYNIDPSHCSVRFSDVFTFQLPNQKLREKMWKLFLPSRVPLSSDINFAKLSEMSLSAKAIRSICFSACSKAAMMTTSKTNILRYNKNSSNNMLSEEDQDSAENSNQQHQPQKDDDENKEKEIVVNMKLLKLAAQEHIEAEERRRPATSMFL